MSELRKDIISGRWIILASERSKRPDDFRPAQPARKEEVPTFCPFCAGNETKTPPEVASLRKPGTRPDQPGWRVRTVPNKFPALSRGLPPERHDEGIYHWMEGVGVQK
jgi:UDPglucose--hexose-1-phosphate uridylyltransferase